MKDFCPACGHAGDRRLGAKNGWELRECRSCGSIFVDPGATVPEASSLYDDHYGAEAPPLPPLVAASLEGLVRRCDGLRRTGRWLDLGFGDGDLLAAAQRHGWTCYGTEASRVALERGRDRGWVVTAEAEQDERFLAGGFDVVTLVEFLEHVPGPRRFLRAAARWLRPGGVLYATTPNARSLNRRLLGLTWSIFVPPQHLTIWSAGGLARALAESGFEGARIRAEGLNPTELLAWLRPARGAAAPPNRNEAARRLNQALSRGPLRRAAKAGVNAGLSLLRLGDTLKAWATR